MKLPCKRPIRPISFYVIPVISLCLIAYLQFASPPQIEHSARDRFTGTQAVELIENIQNMINRLEDEIKLNRQLIEDKEAIGAPHNLGGCSSFDRCVNRAEDRW